MSPKNVLQLIFIYVIIKELYKIYFSEWQELTESFCRIMSGFREEPEVRAFCLKQPMNHERTQADATGRSSVFHLSAGKQSQAFLLKMNVPVSETERLTGKVREKKMGELFADMEKMDIQAERRNTANEKKRADEAQRRAEEAERRADEAEKWANEKDIKAFIEACQELGASREAARDKLIEKKGLSEAVSLEKMALYWKD